jgi:hypothetical protein
LHYLGASIAATAALFESMGNPPVAQQNNLSSLSRHLAPAR